MDNLYSGLSKFFTNLLFSISGGITLFILIVLFFCFFRYWRELRSQYSKADLSVSFYESFIGNIEKEKDQLVEKRRELLEQAKDNKKLGAVWVEFNESLVEVELSDTKRKLYNTIDAAYFFNHHTLAGGLTDNRLFSAVPGFLTAIGVLGTFLGLTFGLSRIDFEGSDPEKIIEGINFMVSGAGTAFITSLFGVFTSLWFNWVEKKSERKIKNRISQLQAKIDAVFPRIVAEQTLTDIKVINRSTEMHLAQLSEKIGDQMQIVMDKTATSISSSITTSLKESLAPAVEKLMDNSREGSEKIMETLIQEFINKIGNVGETQKMAMHNASQALAESSTQMMARLSTFVEQLDEKVTEVRDGNRQMLEQMQSQTQQQNKQAVEFMKTLANSMVEFNQQNQTMLASIQSMLSEKAEEQSEQFANREQNLTASAESFMEKLTKAIDELNRNNTEMLKVIEETLTARINAQADADKARAEELMQQSVKGREAQQSLTDSVKDVLATQSKQNDELSEQLATLSNSFERIAQANKASSEAMDNASSKINDSATGFDNIATRLQTALTNFDAKLATMLLSIEKVTQENSHSATLFNAATDRLETSGLLLEDTVSNLGGTVQTTKSAFDSMQNNFTQFALQLRDHIAALNTDISNLLVDYSNQVQSQTNNRLNEWNEQTREYTSTMKGVVESLSATIDEIEMKLPNRGK